VVKGAATECVAEEQDSRVGSGLQGVDELRSWRGV
jgi:hypothetical protein